MRRVNEFAHNNIMIRITRWTDANRLVICTKYYPVYVKLTTCSKLMVRTYREQVASNPIPFTASGATFESSNNFLIQFITAYEIILGNYCARSWC
jgi:hypothetical protein